MRMMSFALTTEQLLNRSKSVTRRLGWKTAKPGELILPVRKVLGLKKGEKVEVLCPPIYVVSVRFEPLQVLLDSPEYGKEECILEGFPNIAPIEFARMFTGSHKDALLHVPLTRIEFNYTEANHGKD